MVVIKRKPESSTEYESKTYTSGDYDNVIEVDERKSFAENQTTAQTSQTGKAVDKNLYTPREAFTKPASGTSVMPKIDTKPKEVVAPKQEVSQKTKVLLAAYIIIAIVLAAVVIGTGIAISEASKRASGLESRIGAVATLIDGHTPMLNDLNDPDVLEGMAREFGMTDIGEPIEIDLVGEVGTNEYSKTTNAFDKFCDFIAGIFS